MIATAQCSRIRLLKRPTPSKPAKSPDPDGCTCGNGEGLDSTGIDEMGFAEAMAMR